MDADVEMQMRNCFGLAQIHLVKSLADLQAGLESRQGMKFHTSGVPKGGVHLAIDTWGYRSTLSLDDFRECLKVRFKETDKDIIANVCSGLEPTGQAGQLPMLGPDR